MNSNISYQFLNMDFAIHITLSELFYCIRGQPIIGLADYWCRY